jgi:hypothetical protein
MTTRLSGQDTNDVQAVLRNGRSSGSGGSGGSSGRISSLYTLLNAQVSVPVGSGDQQRNVIMYNPLSDPGLQRTLLPQFLDQTTTSQQPELTPRININTASETVLAALPGMSTDLVLAIINARPLTSSDAAPDPIFQTPAWLVTDANLPITMLQQLENYITARTYVYRVQSVGYFDSGGAMARIEAVFDTNLGRPRIVYWRDLSSLGKAYTLGGN